MLQSTNSEDFKHKEEQYKSYIENQDKQIRSYKVKVDEAEKMRVKISTIET